MDYYYQRIFVNVRQYFTNFQRAIQLYVIYNCTALYQLFEQNHLIHKYSTSITAFKMTRQVKFVILHHIQNLERN